IRAIVAHRFRRAWGLQTPTEFRARQFQTATEGSTHQGHSRAAPTDRQRVDGETKKLRPDRFCRDWRRNRRGDARRIAEALRQPLDQGRIALQAAAWRE